LAQLGDYAYEKALDAAVNYVETLIQYHRTVRGAVSGAHPEVACLNAARAVVRNHFIDDVNVYDASGQPVTSGPIRPGAIDTSELDVLIKRPRDDRWAVAERYVSTAGAMPTESQLCQG
jgi:hypothetical protein